MTAITPSIRTAYTEGLVAYKVCHHEVNPYCKEKQPAEHSAWLKGYYLEELVEPTKEDSIHDILERIEIKLTAIETILKHGR